VTVAVVAVVDTVEAVLFHVMYIISFQIGAGAEVDVDLFLGSEGRHRFGRDGLVTTIKGGHIPAAGVRASVQLGSPDVA